MSLRQWSVAGSFKERVKVSLLSIDVSDVGPEASIVNVRGNFDDTPGASPSAEENL
jgi:hypothetical protein